MQKTPKPQPAPQKRNRVQIFFDPDEGRTQQQFKDECDINNIMAKYQVTGVVDHVAKYDGQYGEIPEIDYHKAMTVIADANSMFEELPSSVRDHFNNDPAGFLKFCEDEENIDKLREWNLANPIPLSDSVRQEAAQDHAGSGEAASMSTPASKENDAPESK